MQILSFKPGTAVTVFSQVFNHQAHVFEIADACLGVPEPEAFGVSLHQGRRPGRQLRWRWGWWRKLLEFRRVAWRGSHEQSLRADWKDSNSIAAHSKGLCEDSRSPQLSPLN